MANFAAAVGPQELARKIYAVAQEGVPTSFIQLQCSAVGEGGGSDRAAALHI